MGLNFRRLQGRTVHDCSQESPISRFTVSPSSSIGEMATASHKSRSPSDRPTEEFDGTTSKIAAAEGVEVAVRHHFRLKDGGSIASQTTTRRILKSTQQKRLSPVTGHSLHRQVDGARKSRISRKSMQCHFLFCLVTLAIRGGNVSEALVLHPKPTGFSFQKAAFSQRTHRITGVPSARLSHVMVMTATKDGNENDGNDVNRVEGASATPASKRTTPIARTKTQPRKHTPKQRHWQPQQQQQYTRSNNRRPPQSNNQNSDALKAAKKLNQDIVACQTPSEVLAKFVSVGGARGTAGNDALNTVNFSTCLHRVAKTIFNPVQTGDVVMSGKQRWNEIDQSKRNTITDPRFAMYLCALAEALAQNPQRFKSRELSNVSWAIAKLTLAPNQDIQPLVRLRRHVEGEEGEGAGMVVLDGTSSKDSKEVILKRLYESSRKVRDGVLNVARERALIDDPSERDKIMKSYLPDLRALAGDLLDSIGAQVLDITDTFNAQETANLIWAFATAGRADSVLCQKLAQRLIDSNPITSVNTIAKPQEMSNSAWAMATAGVRGPVQEGLFQYIADALDTGNDVTLAKFKPQELSNTAWAFATLLSKRSDSKTTNHVGSGDASHSAEDQSVLRTFRRICVSLIDRCEQFKPQELANTAWAFATVGFGSDGTSSNPNGGNLHLTNAANIGMDNDADDRVLLNKALKRLAKDALKRLNRFSPQELNNLAWAFARLNGSHALKEGDVNVTQDLFDGISREIKRRYMQFSPQDIGTTLWSFATAGYSNDETVFHVAASRLTLREAPNFKPQELSNSVWALATVGISPSNLNVFDTTMMPDVNTDLKTIRSDPIMECFAAVAVEVMKRPFAFKDQELKDVLWSFSKAGVRHPLLFKKVAEHLVGKHPAHQQTATDASPQSRGLDHFSSQGLGNLAWSYAKQSQLAQQNTDPSIDGYISLGSNGRLAVYQTSCLDVGEDLINRLFAGFARAGMNENAGGLTRFMPQDLSNTAWAFVTLGLLHRSFFEAIAKEITHRVPVYLKQPRSQRSTNSPVYFKAQELANLVWSYAILNFRAPIMLDVVADHIVSSCSTNQNKSSPSYDEHSIAKVFNRQELANLAWSCAVLEQYPPDLMPLLYTGLVGDGNAENADKLSNFFDDDGLQKQAVMSLLYVQMALDMEAPHIGISLPKGFPNGWTDKSWSFPSTAGSPSSKKQKTRSNSNSPDDSSQFLELMTSRMQKDVSLACNRIGFSHTHEHVIGHDELSELHGIEFSSDIPLNFLSIDIVNLEKKVGIEVDGPAHFSTILDNIEDVDKSNGDTDNEVLKQTPSNGDDSLPDIEQDHLWQVQSTGYAKRIGNETRWNFSGKGVTGRRQENGPTAFKHRLLCHLDWSIIHLPYWEWNSLGGGAESESQYCRDLLKEVIE